MPVPKPNKDESQKDYVSRCIETVMGDGTTEDNKQAAAICYSTWREHQNAGKSLALSALITRAERQRDGRVRWRARANSGDYDQQDERFDESFFDELVHNFGVVQEALTRSEVPSLPVPILDLAHYSLFIPRAERARARAGYPNRLWRDGKALMAEGYFDSTPLGQLAAKAALERQTDDRRVSICVWPDWGNVEDTAAGRVFKGGRGVAYLDHLAMTAHPVDADTEIKVLEVKSMATITDDAAQVLGDSEEAQKEIAVLEAARLKSDVVAPPDGVVIKTEPIEEVATPIVKADEPKPEPAPQAAPLEPVVKAEDASEEAAPNPTPEKAAPQDSTTAIANALRDLLPQIAAAIDERLKAVASLPAQLAALKAEVDALKAPTAEKVKAALDAEPSSDWLTLMIKNSVQRPSTGTVKGEGKPAETSGGDYAAMFGNPTKP